VLRALLLLLVGVLVGANVVYFVMTRGQRDGADAAPVQSVERMPVEVAAPTMAAGAANPVDASVPAPQASPVPASPASSSSAPRAPASSGPAGLIVPVRGIAAVSLADTYADARSEGRSHDAIDIMAPAGTPVLAAADGYVEKLFTSDRGGLTLYQFEPGGRYAYYYAHLQAYAPGLHEKQQLRQGEVVGYVGSTGNASADAPHLHFAIFVLGPEKQWWEGTAINPYPLLHGKAP
jgi:murein DD-endopeptidase MepM/ murein hydrolase activator NlpD